MILLLNSSSLQKIITQKRFHGSIYMATRITYRSKNHILQIKLLNLYNPLKRIQIYNGFSTKSFNLHNDAKNFSISYYNIKNAEVL